MTDAMTSGVEPECPDCGALIEGEYGEVPATATEMAVHVAVNCSDCGVPIARVETEERPLPLLIHQAEGFCS